MLKKRIEASYGTVEQWSATHSLTEVNMLMFFRQSVANL